MANLAVKQPRRPHLGQGFAFPFRMSQQGGFALSAEDQSVRESIWLILLTEPGERLYRPSFGCRISELAFAPINAETLMLMRIWVKEALEQWEPRIELANVLAQPQLAQGRVYLTINYRLRKTHEHRSLVYPFYLNRDIDGENTGGQVIHAYLERP